MPTNSGSAPSTSPPARQFEFFGGKGGVGKTTCAAARAIDAARSGRRVLVVSTDPAHSLGDALGVRLTWRKTKISLGTTSGGGRRGRLDAIEIDAPRALARWMSEHGAALGDAVEHGTWLERADIEELLGLPMPGIDELLALLDIVRLSAKGAYDLVVVDTAPTGHTLRVLGAPAAVAAVARALDDLQREHRIVREQLAGLRRPDAADRLIALLEEDARAAGGLLRNAARSAFRWVTLAEDLALAETLDALAALDAARIPVLDVIVNRAVADGPSCPICDRRRFDERLLIAGLPRTLGPGRTVRVLVEQLAEPRGRRRLGPIGAALRAKAPRGPARAATVVVYPARFDREARGLRRPAASAPPRMPRQASLVEMLGDARLVFVGGKGGVGKTTVAAAAALTLARRNAGHRVLLLSTDPAHSLADVLGQEIGDAAVGVAGAPPNLRAREMDAASALAARRADLEAALDSIARVGAPTTGSIRVAPLTRGASDLLELAPPGIDELFGVLSVIEAEATCRTIVVDTAPTGHALRLLQMPDSAREWVQALLRVLLKYRDVTRAGQLGAALVDLSRSIRRLQELMRDPGRARVVVVTRAAELPRAETERLLAELRALDLNTAAVVVNARTLSPGDCPRCRAIAAAERRSLTALARACRRTTPDCAIIQTPLAAPPPRGVELLEKWARIWIDPPARRIRPAL